LILAGASSIVNGQPSATPPPDGNQFAQQNRPKLLEILNLSKQQIQQIRRLTLEFRPQMQEAKKRWEMANMELDKAVYNDNYNETDIQARLREAQLAHAEMIKTRTMQESAIRRVLTPTQLVRFRQLRQEFELQKRQLNKEERQITKQQPQPTINRLKNLPKRQILRPQTRPAN
jgi:hypothetical protein